MLPTLPIVQAPMAGVQGSALAVAVGRTGALGSLPAAMLSDDALAAELTVLAEAAVPYSVNFFAHRPPEPDPVREDAWVEVLAPTARSSAWRRPVGEPPAGRSTPASATSSNPSRHRS